jgi:hypothetical protein
MAGTLCFCPSIAMLRGISPTMNARAADDNVSNTGEKHLSSRPYGINDFTEILRPNLL